jgi:hypothetical protein
MRSPIIYHFKQAQTGAEDPLIRHNSRPSMPVQIPVRMPGKIRNHLYSKNLVRINLYIKKTTGQYALVFSGIVVRQKALAGGGWEESQGPICR